MEVCFFGGQFLVVIDIEIWDVVFSQCFSSLQSFFTGFFNSGLIAGVGFVVE
jgi:hypothetical protein